VYKNTQEGGNMIYLMRHGLDDESYIGGWSDVGLTELGKEQVQNTSKFLESLNIKKIVSSDIYRAQQTAEIVNSYLNVELHYDESLRELDKGLVTGMDVKKARLIYPNIKKYNIYDKYPNGEAMIDLYNRVKLLLNDLKDLDETLVVTHRGIINMIYYLMNDIELDMDKEKFNVTHASIHEFDYSKKLVRRIY